MVFIWGMGDLLAYKKRIANKKDLCNPELVPLKFTH